MVALSEHVCSNLKSEQVYTLYKNWIEHMVAQALTADHTAKLAAYNKTLSCLFLDNNYVLRMSCDGPNAALQGSDNVLAPLKVCVLNHLDYC